MAAALDGADYVVHLAAETGTGQSMYEIAKYGETNMQGTAVLLDLIANASTRRVRRIVVASSRAVYGEGAYVCGACDPGMRIYPETRTAEQLRTHHWEFACPSCGADMQAVATREDDPMKPASIYAATKCAQEHLVTASCRAMGIEFVNLRYQNVYGEGQSLNNPYMGLLTTFSTRLRRGLPLPLFEDGLESRDFIHVDDAADATVAALERDVAGLAINVGSGDNTSIREVATQLAAAFGVAAEIGPTAEYRLGDIRHNYADVGRMRTMLAFDPRVTLTEGIARFVAWTNTQPLPPDRSQAANDEMKARQLMG
jgi:dTDP-L-rhamnose 4-epimerase